MNHLEVKLPRARVKHHNRSVNRPSHDVVLKSLVHRNTIHVGVVNKPTALSQDRSVFLSILKEMENKKQT